MLNVFTVLLLLHGLVFTASANSDNRINVTVYKINQNKTLTLDVNKGVTRTGNIRNLVGLSSMKDSECSDGSVDIDIGHECYTQWKDEPFNLLVSSWGMQMNIWRSSDMTEVKVSGTCLSEDHHLVEIQPDDGSEEWLVNEFNESWISTDFENFTHLLECRTVIPSTTVKPTKISETVPSTSYTTDTATTSNSNNLPENVLPVEEHVVIIIIALCCILAVTVVVLCSCIWRSRITKELKKLRIWCCKETTIHSDKEAEIGEIRRDENELIEFDPTYDILEKPGLVNGYSKVSCDDDTGRPSIRVSDGHYEDLPDIDETAELPTARDSSVDNVKSESNPDTYAVVMKGEKSSPTE